MESANWYGRSRHENIREHAWWPWIQTAKNQTKYASKIAGVIPMIKYPIGTSRDANGSEQSNYDIAKAVLNNLGSGNGVTMPQQLLPWVQELARTGIDPEKLAAWQISFMEPKGNHSMGFVNTLKHYEALILRGWLVPERAAVEGSFGTKAEAGTHGDLATAMAVIAFNDMLNSINWYVVNPLLTLNFGMEFENKVWLSNSGLDPAIAAFYRDIVKEILTAPGNIDLFQTWVDVNTIIDSVGLPKAEETLQIVKIGDKPSDDDKKKIQEDVTKKLFEDMNNDK